MILLLTMLLLLLLLYGKIPFPSISLLSSYSLHAYSQILSSSMPSVRDPDFVVQEFIPNLSQPTSIAFVNERTAKMLA
jgi:hypothetical protein